MNIIMKMNKNKNNKNKNDSILYIYINNLNIFYRIYIYYKNIYNYVAIWDQIVSIC